jgi:hypothetical protein
MIRQVGLVIYCGLVLAAMHYGDAANDVQPWYDPVKAEHVRFGYDYFTPSNSQLNPT